MAVDLSGLSFFNPLFVFVLLFLIVFAILEKTKIIGESKPIQVIISLVLSLIFISVSEVRGYAESIVPGFAILAIAVFFTLFLAAALLGKPDAIAKPWLGWVFVILLALIFIYQGFYHLDVPSNHAYISIGDWLHNPKVAGGLWLVIFGAIVTFAVTRKAGK